MLFLQPRRFLYVLTILLGLSSGLVAADDVKLKPDHPERYTVVKGDTLWDIASRFLQSPWHWPRVWKINDKIKNPHLIYPGDVILLRYVDGKPELIMLRNEKVAADGTTETVADSNTAEPAKVESPVSDTRAGSDVKKLSPKVYSEALNSAIPTIPPNIIVPFLTNPLAVGDKELERAGYVTIGLDNRIALGNQSEFYARGVREPDAEYFRIFRPGKPLKNPDTGELLAYEALYLGDARKLENGDPSKFVVTAVKQEILPSDRLMAAGSRAALPYYFPHSPDKAVNGRIIAALNSVAEIGSQTVVAISLGEREGIEEGHVLRVMYRQGKHKDPVTGDTYKLPDEESALLLVFRTFEKVSYALVMNATQPVHLLDAVTTP